MKRGEEGVRRKKEKRRKKRRKKDKKQERIRRTTMPDGSCRPRGCADVDGSTDPVLR